MFLVAPGLGRTWTALSWPGLSRLLCLFLISAVAGFFGNSAWAHSPYYTEVADLPGGVAGPVSLKLWHGDGIVVSNPVRAVVVDAQGILLAASPVSVTLQIGCSGAWAQRQCIAYDSLTLIVYEPQPEMWNNWGRLEENGRPNSYPEHMGEAFGFTRRPATIAEILRFEIAGLVQFWLTTLIAITWWTLFWLLVLPVFRRKPRRPGVVAISLRLFAGALLILPAAFSWTISPYSLFYLSFVFLMGAVIAHILGKPVAVTQKPA